MLCCIQIVRSFQERAARLSDAMAAQAVAFRALSPRSCSLGGGGDKLSKLLLNTEKLVYRCFTVFNQRYSGKPCRELAGTFHDEV